MRTNEVIARLRNLEDEIARLQSKVRNLIHMLQEDGVDNDPDVV